MADFKNEFTWSKSRDALFNNCLRAYYYNHYGSWGGWKRDAPPDIREIYVMKNLNSRAAWVGIIVHDVAELAVRRIKAGTPWSEKDALAESERRMRLELDLPEQGAYRRAAKQRWGGNQIKAPGLEAHYYDSGVTPAQWEEDIATVRACLRTFFASPVYRRLTSITPDDILMVEELESFPVEAIKVWVKLDVAVRGKDAAVVIIDWKTGRAHRQKDISLQLGIYGLYGSRRWGLAAERIRGYDVNLRIGETRQHPIDQEVLERVTHYIAQSAEKMRNLLDDVEQNTASMEKFPQIEPSSVCGRCNFRRACERE